MQLAALKTARCDRVFIDTATPTGRVLWQMIGMLEEYERTLIQERTQTGRSVVITGVERAVSPS